MAQRSGPWLIAFPFETRGRTMACGDSFRINWASEGLLTAASGEARACCATLVRTIAAAAAAGEDLDLLVDDSSLEEVRTMLDEGPGIQPIDLYSVTGLPGADFRSMPYFPPYLAEELLDRAIVHRGLCSVPAPREHFLSLAYHALYHKGLRRGFRPATSAKRQRPRAGSRLFGDSARLASGSVCREHHAGRTRRVPRFAGLAATARYADSTVATQSLGSLVAARRSEDTRAPMIASRCFCSRGSAPPWRRETGSQ